MNVCYGTIPGACYRNLVCVPFTLYHPTTCFAGNKIQVLAWEHANPAVKTQIHQLRDVSDDMRTWSEIPLRLPLMAADAIILEQHLGRTHATEFIRAVDPWCYPGEKTQASLELRSCVQHVLKKSRSAMKNLHHFSEESKSAFLLSPILIKERPALIRKPKAERGNSAPEAPPAPAAPVDLSAFPASIVPPPSNLLPACHVQPPAPPPVIPALPPTPHAAPAQAAPMPLPSPGQCFDDGSHVRLFADTTPGVVPVRATGLLFATVDGYEGGNEYYVKSSGSDGRVSRRRVSGDFLVRQSLDGVGAMFRGDERRGGSAARDLARAADVCRKADERAAAAVATSEAAAAKRVAKAKKEAEKELLRAADASRRLEKEAAAKVAAAAKRLAKAEKKAEIDSLRAADTSRKAVKRAAVESAAATESVAQAKKEVIELKKRAKAAESSAAASAAERDALYSGDLTSPRLTKEGLLLAAKVQVQSTWEHETKVRRLKRHVTSEAKARENAENVAKIKAEVEIAEKATRQRNKARREKRQSGKKLAKASAAAAKLKNGRSSSATCKLACFQPSVFFSYLLVVLAIF